MTRARRRLVGQMPSAAESFSEMRNDDHPARPLDMPARRGMIHDDAQKIAEQAAMRRHSRRELLSIGL